MVELPSSLPKSKPSLLAPIFLFSNWRTGGTALAFTFRKHPDCYVYTEPLNPILKDPDLALGTKTSSWKSKHPENEYYFTEYEPLLTAPDHRFFFPDLEKLPYVLQAEDKQEDLRAYFSNLISFAHSKNKIPVFKLEQLEGSASWIKANFPDSLCVGVTRNADYQFISWLEQATYGNYLFFETAHRIIENNLSFFMTDSIPVSGRGDIESYRKIFDVFKRTIDLQHKNFMDFCVDISPDSKEPLDVQLGRVDSCDPGRAELWRFVLQTVRDTLIREPDTRVTIVRLENTLGILAEKNALLAEKKALLAELGQANLDKQQLHKDKQELQRRLEAIFNSRSWRMTIPLRKLNEKLQQLLQR